MEELKDYRAAIDRIDRELQRLFEERMEESGKIGRYKAERNLPVFDAAREEEKIASMRASASGDANADGIEKLMRTIFEISRDLQEHLM